MVGGGVTQVDDPLVYGKQCSSGHANLFAVVSSAVYGVFDHLRTQPYRVTRVEPFRHADHEANVCDVCPAIIHHN